MTVPIVQHKPSHDRLQQHRFLAPLGEIFTRRSNGKSWPRRANTRTTAHAYMRGLLGPGRGKNMHGIARRVHLDDDRIERFVRESPWEHAAVQDHLMGHTPTATQSPHAAFVIDDVAIVKKGAMSVAAYR